MGLSIILLISSFLMATVHTTPWRFTIIIEEVGKTVENLELVKELCILGPDHDFYAKEISSDLESALHNMKEVRKEIDSDETYLWKVHRIVEDVQKTNNRLIDRRLPVHEDAVPTEERPVREFKTNGERGEFPIPHKTYRLRENFLIATKKLKHNLDNLIKKIEWRLLLKRIGPPIMDRSN
ncbi:hypothetical protein D915_004094 [Fasciola hepatica]|uniref:Uncharacterized protein n=1 Tax=Fasciola hepatica TaxID=6192 RepID=A0A4E0REC8_FASHE|nr:hypothetical protein D915_004094 [Fasciola hepatica]